ncbi:MAG: DUF1013 domain-containing protein [Hyphomicrobiaceae bacterium]
MSTPTHPLMPKATAVWLVDNTSLTFEQISEFCGMHLLEVKGIADGDVAQGVRGKNPVTSGELSRDEISKAEEDPDHRLKLLTSKVKIPEIKVKKRPRYTPVSRRQDRPNAVLWILRNHAELKDSQIMRLVGTTKPTIAQIRDRSHWNSANLVPQDPVMLGLCAQMDLDTEVEKAAKRVAKERQAMGLPPIEAAGTLLPTAETTGYELPSEDGAPSAEEPAPTAENIFGETAPPEPTSEETAEADEAARVFARLQDMKPADEPADDMPDNPFAKLQALKSEEEEAPAEAPEADAAPPNQAHYDALKAYVPDFDQAAVDGIVKHLGIALRSKDASLVACSSKEELERVRESWCKKKLALSEDDDALDQMIKDVCETMKGDHQKSRVVFYYLLAQNCGKVGELA